MKIYFNYNQVISSKDMSEAIAMVKGVGPIVGFGSSTIDTVNNKITIKPLPVSTHPMYNTMLGRLNQWNIYKGPDSSELGQTYFAGITRDGYVFGSDQETLDVYIQGSKSIYNEVLVFAYHTPIQEPIDNPVSFLAFWSESGDSFYDLYKKSLDPYYPIKDSDRVVNFSSHTGVDPNINYAALDKAAMDACTYYQQNSSSLVLIGIYGTGSNAISGTNNEEFSLVPYDGEFPNHLQYNPSIHNSLINSLSRVESMLSDISYDDTVGNLMENLKSQILEQIRAEISLMALPIGTIVLWKGDTIPEGWAEFTDAAGRVVVGYMSGGIKIPSSPTGSSTSTVLTSVGSLYNPSDGDYSSTLNMGNLPAHVHGVGLSKGGQDNSSDDDKSVLQGWNNRDTTLNGDVGDRGSSVNVKNGGVDTSNNFTISGQQSQSNIDQWNAIKLPKAITLKYIIKVS